MKIAMIGLGKMGANMTQRLIEHGHEVVAFDLSDQARTAAAAFGAEPAATLEEVAAKLSRPRVAWVMVPAGEATNSTITSLAGLFESGDVIIDGGNSNYKETAPLVGAAGRQGIALVDAGTSGGIWGLKEGYCLMVGGTKEAVAVAEPVFVDLAPEGGYAHVGPAGAGHFVKMVHNGIEYGLMQAYAEGFEIMSEAPEFDLDLHEIAAIWRYGSVVRSWLLELAERALRPDSGFDQIEGRGGRLRRGPLDRRGGHQPGGVGAGDLLGPVRPVRLPEEGCLRHAPGLGPAQPVRRPRLHHRGRHAGRGDLHPQMTRPSKPTPGPGARPKGAASLPPVLSKAPPGGHGHLRGLRRPHRPQDPPRPGPPGRPGGARRRVHRHRGGPHRME